MMSIGQPSRKGVSDVRIYHFGGVVGCFTVQAKLFVHVVNIIVIL